jgi:RNA polymerase sigma-70 factor (ECF subfamily)
MLQEVLLKAWRGLRSGQEPRRFGPWLFTIAHRLLIDRSRHERARPRLVAEGESEEPVRNETPEDDFLALETQQRLKTAMATLSEKQGQVFLLRLTSDLTFREIADLRGEPLSTVLGHMSYAVAKLKKRLNP